jgi:ATP-dependent DNA helicase PIF1
MLGGSSSETLAITASTGIASVNIGGSTLHSWAGIGIGEETAQKFSGRVLHQPAFSQVLNRWQQVKTLIIDESTESHTPSYFSLTNLYDASFYD